MKFNLTNPQREIIRGMIRIGLSMRGGNRYGDGIAYGYLSAAKFVAYKFKLENFLKN